MSARNKSNTAGFTLERGVREDQREKEEEIQELKPLPPQHCYLYTCIVVDGSLYRTNSGSLKGRKRKKKVPLASIKQATLTCLIDNREGLFPVPYVEEINH